MSHEDKVAGMRRNLEAKTGRTVDGWIAALDSAGIIDAKEVRTRRPSGAGDRRRLVHLRNPQVDRSASGPVPPRRPRPPRAFLKDAGVGHFQIRLILSDRTAR